MIRAIRCSEPSFKSVTFTSGFNVVLAECTQESTQKDSRNGLGKSTLIEIIHFCLGSSLSRGVLSSSALAGWTFSVELLLNGKVITVSRNTSSANNVAVEGDTDGWPSQLTPDLFGRITLSVDEWTKILGILMFDLPEEEEKKYHPSFRSLISYFIRRGRDAFSVPFEHHRKQREFDVQMCNAFLLGLAWEDASDLQTVKDKNELVNDLRRAAKAGIIDDVLGSIGELEARRVQLLAKSRRETQSLSEFNVHHQYHDIREEADALNTEIQAFLLENQSDREWLSLYQSSANDVDSVDTNDSETIAQLYKEVGVNFPDSALRQLEEVREFHQRVIENRKKFLSSEIGRLERAIADRDAIIQEKSGVKASLMGILNSHGALDEYSKLQERLQTTNQAIRDLDAQISNLRRFESGRNDLKIEQMLLQRRMQQDYEERQIQRDRAISQFNANSEALYDAPGTLIIDVAQTGFKFGVEIERSGSVGIDSMKIFCYDLMLSQLWSQEEKSPRFLVHDSIIFDGVDERQVANALELAAKESEDKGFQYICTFNSDSVPEKDLSPDFDLMQYVRLRLTDATEDGCLLGKRF